VILLKHFNQKGRSTVDWARWRHNAIDPQGPRA